jgi:capsular exopolysaccharide synthesis family protein
VNDHFLPSDSSRRDLASIGPSTTSAALYEAPDIDDDRSDGVDIQRYLSTIYRWKWLFLGAVVACMAVALAWASLQTPIYRSSATLELNPAPTQVVKTQENNERALYDDDFLALQLGLIKSRALAERVARSLNLGANKAFLGADVPRAQANEAAVGKLMGGLSASGTTSDRIVKLDYVHPDPQLAARVANAFADQAIESNFERSYAATARSRQFLQRRLTATRRDLEQSERALIDYARQAKIVNVVSGDAVQSGDSAGGTLLASNLVALNGQLAEAQNARITAQQRYAQGSAAASAAAGADPTVQLLQQQKAQLQASLAEMGERYLPDHPQMVTLRARIEAVDRQIASSSSRSSSSVTDTLRADMIAAQNRERALQARINQLQSGLLDLNDRGVQYNILKRSVEANRALYNALLEQLGVENSSGTRTSGIAVIDQAQPAGAPFSPNIPRTLILGLLGGLVLGAGSVFAADRFYDTVDTPDDVKRLLNLPLLGVVPSAGKNESLDVLISDPQSHIAEAFHSVRTAIQFAVSGGAPKSILMTSSRPNEGKTTSTIALAADFISVGKRVVVVDADLRKPSFRGGTPGLVGVLANACSVEEALVATESPRLWLLPAGKRPPNPTALLTGHELADLMRTLAREFDVVIIDGPPVMGFADSPLLGAVTEAAVLVVGSGLTSRAVGLEAIGRLQSTGTVIIGAILNKFDRRTHAFAYSGASYGYDYSYAGEREKRDLVAPQAPPALEQHTTEE